MCARCERPVSVCYCAALTAIETRSKIVILQHPREHGMPIGTAHMASLCLPQASLHVGIQWDGSEVLRDACGDPERPAILLYPGEDARDILREPPPAPVTLVVVDGTWSQARTLVRDNPELAQLPRYAFFAPEPSKYRIRREPSPECVSTIEALMYVLGAIEGDVERFRPLLEPMNAMVDAQVAAQENAVSERTSRSKLRKRLSPYERLPALIREGYEDLVLVVGDANAWPHGTPERRHGDELVYWVAHRPSTGETFEYVVRPRIPLAPNIPGHVGLAEEDLADGGSVDGLLTAFGTFLRPSDVVCAWGHHALRMFKDCGGEIPGAFLDLQEAARLLTNTNPGTLDRYGAALEVPLPDDLPPGRAGRRLGMLMRILESWCALPGSA